MITKGLRSAPPKLPWRHGSQTHSSNVNGSAQPRKQLLKGDLGGLITTTNLPPLGGSCLVLRTRVAACSQIPKTLRSRFPSPQIPKRRNICHIKYIKQGGKGRRTADTRGPTRGAHGGALRRTHQRPGPASSGRGSKLRLEHGLEQHPHGTKYGTPLDGRGGVCVRHAPAHVKRRCRFV